MTAGFTAPESFDPRRHDTAGFACGHEPLDRWLAQYAGQAQRRDAARTFVTTSDGRTINGYYTLLAGQLEHTAATSAVRHGLSSHFPIPVAILARLAVDYRHQRQGLGAALLRDASMRTAHASQYVAIRALVVHAIDETAAAFYERFGFRPLMAQPRTLMVTIADLRAAGFVP